MPKFETKEFTLCDECVKVKTTVEELIGAAILTGLTKHEAYSVVFDVLSELMSEKDRKFVMDMIKEIVQ